MKKLLYYSALILFFISPLVSNSQDFVRIENIEFQTRDLGEMTYDNAKIAINNLGEGWRLPNERELIMMFNYQNKIGGLSRREYKVVQDYWIYTGNYCGENSNGQLVILRTLVDPGLTLTYNKSDVDKRTFSFIRAVRNVPDLKKVVSKNSAKAKSSGSSENQGCETTILEYEKFAKEFIKYSNSVKAGTVKFNINEFVKWEKEIRKQNNLITECATSENRLRVLKIMNKVVPAVQSLYGTSSSSSVSYSNSSSKSPSSNASKSKVTSNNQKKSNDKRVDLSTEIITQSVSCKFCNSTVTVQRNVPRSPEFKSSFNESGGITSSMCRKCNKTSSFNYEMRAGNFVRIY